MLRLELDQPAKFSHEHALMKHPSVPSIQTAWHAVTDYHRASHKSGIARKYVAWPSLPKGSQQKRNKFGSQENGVKIDYPHVCPQCKTCTEIRALWWTYAAHLPELPDMSFVRALLMWKRVSVFVCALDENEHGDDQRWLHCAPHSHTHIARFIKITCQLWLWGWQLGAILVRRLVQV